MLHLVYATASRKGGHPGIADAIWSRLARKFVFLAAAFLVERYIEWRRGDAVVSASKAAPRSLAWRIPQLMKLVARVLPRRTARCAER